MDDDQNWSGLPITKEEIYHAIKAAKNNKALGPNEIPSEIIKLLNYENLIVLVRTFNGI